jgi:CheY-like chemotaxis protein
VPGHELRVLAGLAQVATVQRLVLADIHQPGCSGLTELADLRRRLPEVYRF